MHFDERLRLALGSLLIVATVAYGVFIARASPEPMSREGHHVYLDVEAVAHLQVGAPVRRSGFVLGRVVALRRDLHPKEPPRKARLRLVLWIDAERAGLLPRGGRLRIAAPSPLGKQHVEVDAPASSTPTSEAPAPPEHVFRGTDPALLDRLVNVGWQSFGELWKVVRELRPTAARLGANIDSLGAELRRQDLGPRLVAAAKSFEALAGELEEAWQRYGRTLRRSPKSVRRLVRAIGARRQRLRDLATRGKALAKTLRAVSTLVDRKQRDRLQRLRSTLSRTLALTRRSVRLVGKLVAGLRQGRGTAGRLLTDRELNSDLKASHRALKRAPWRALRLPPRRQAPRRKAPRRPSPR